MHPYTKNELNQFTNSAIISADARTCFPLHRLFFTTNVSISYLNIYLYIGANENFLKSTDIQTLLPHIYTLKNYQINYQIICLKCVPYLMRNSCHKTFSPAHYSVPSNVDM